MVIFIFWLSFSLLVSYFAKIKNRGTGNWFLISMIVSPLLAAVILLFLENKGVKTCPKCAEQVKTEAVKCKHCGHEFGSNEEAKIVKNIEDETSKLKIF